jgi:hypothetical protein
MKGDRDDIDTHARIFHVYHHHHHHHHHHHDRGAIVRVSLLNKGTDPFKKQQYGDYITVRAWPLDHPTIHPRLHHTHSAQRTLAYAHRVDLFSLSPSHKHTNQVERKIERNGSSSYALLKGNPHSDSPKYTVVSKSKEELVAMLDAFNIQVRLVPACLPACCTHGYMCQPLIMVIVMMIDDGMVATPQSSLPVSLSSTHA